MSEQAGLALQASADAHWSLLDPAMGVAYSASGPRLTPARCAAEQHKERRNKTAKLLKDLDEVCTRAVTGTRP